MGNSIRWLKDLVIKIDPSMSESEAKSHIISSIDLFIRDRVTAAGIMIRDKAVECISPHDVILVYASSSIVQNALVAAHKRCVPFRVIAVDSKPLFEGKALANSLSQHGIDVQYYQISAAAHAMRSATKVFLGAHAMLSNGRLYSRVGTAMVAMLAHESDIPVIVCSESIKFTERVALDSIVGNEVAPAEELLTDAERDALFPLLDDSAIKEKDEVDQSGKDKSHGGRGGEEVLARWRESPNLQMLNVLYDVTPAEYIKMVITEFGALPPSSVPVVHRISQIQV
jgi:translation initiation factor eIF-2B subunit delta